VLRYLARDEAPRRETPMSLSLTWADAVVLVVGDLERSRDFYTKSLGMVTGGGDEDVVVFKTESGGMLILLSHHRADSLLGADNVDHGVAAAARTYNVAEVEDVDQACETLRSRGVDFFREPESHPWGIRTAFFRDPDGHVWEISSDLPEE
jgi:catechol 2,3-dioxygenase-like lactoylglutathione lyase family enzyme